jgi:hypothetical protein
MGWSTEGKMDRVIGVAFYVHGDINGLMLEWRVSTLEHGSARVEWFGNLTVAELLCAVEAALDHVQPGDGWIDGHPQMRIPGL